MKKIISLILIFGFLMSCSLPAAAASEENRKDVSAQYEEGAQSPEVYSVDVQWGAMLFSYKAEGMLEWDAETNTYVERTGEEWIPDGNDVTVINHSNREVKVTFAYCSVDAYGAVTGSFDHGEQTVPSAVGTAVANAPFAKAYLTLTGKLPETGNRTTRIGTITVTIA